LSITHSRYTNKEKKALEIVDLKKKEKKNDIG